MQNLEVTCTVSNCIFHDKRNLCGAEKIEINMDYQTIKKDRTEFGADFDLKTTSTKAANSTETCCNTFKPKKI